ncbi:hypothetical protein D3C77_615570 [compost metagenome]
MSSGISSTWLWAPNTAMVLRNWWEAIFHGLPTLYFGSERQSASGSIASSSRMSASSIRIGGKYFSYRVKFLMMTVAPEAFWENGKKLGVRSRQSLPFVPSGT